MAGSLRLSGPSGWSTPRRSFVSGFVLPMTDGPLGSGSLIASLPNGIDGAVRRMHHGVSLGTWRVMRRPGCVNGSDSTRVVDGRRAPSAGDAGDGEDACKRESHHLCSPSVGDGKANKAVNRMRRNNRSHEQNRPLHGLFCS